ncbi:MAG: hypothetical protein FJ135_14505 [Deltaproteobacteria bacterium]|nr:hypothetical protein [Deltaproteobacteria bacterium]
MIRQRISQRLGKGAKASPCLGGRRRQLCLIMLMVGMMLAGCTTTSQGERRLNLSPLFFYSEAPGADRGRVEILGPVFSREWFGPTTLTTVAPLFYVLSKDGEGVEAEFLYPFGQYKSGGGDTRFNIIPFSSYRDELPEGASSFQFFPFYGGRTSKGERYGGIFPLYGTFKERFGRDQAVFFLWPLYSRTVAEGTYRYNFLWPFFSYATGGEKALTFWPFGGKIVKPGEYEKYFALWPLINYQRLRLDTDNPQTIKSFIPFYVWDTSPEHSRKSILFPFFTHYRQEKGNYDQWDTPWPLIVRGQGDDFSLRSYFPFYYHRQEPGRERRAIFWWLYDRRTDETGDSWEQSYRYLFFSRYVAEIDSRGEWSEKHRVWPFCYYTSRSGFLHFHAPELIFITSPGFDRLFGPWVYLWTQDRLDDYRQGKAFWGIYRWEENQNYRLWELSFLASRETTGTGSTFRLLSGLMTWERDGERRRLKLFYLPRGFSW